MPGGDTRFADALTGICGSHYEDCEGCADCANDDERVWKRVAGDIGFETYEANLQAWADASGSGGDDRWIVEGCGLIPERRR